MQRPPPPLGPVWKICSSEEIKPVEVPDMEVGAFKAMLAFIYADDLSGLNGDNAISPTTARPIVDFNGRSIELPGFNLIVAIAVHPQDTFLARFLQCAIYEFCLQIIDGLINEMLPFLSTST
ncbi:hypothetical protein GPALN_002296 [Globodera pallida]|nr:hypothetical protein GPALN_002296 [Globodera pallida]